MLTFLADEYQDRLGKSDNGFSVSEKPCISNSGTNPYAFQHYSDNPPNQTLGPMPALQVS